MAMALDAVDLVRNLPQDLSEQAFRIGTELLEDQILKCAWARRHIKCWLVTTVEKPMHDVFLFGSGADTRLETY